MPNPFPGMDPYLEGDLWTSVHTDLCAEISRQLAPKVRPKYVALTTRRVVVAPPDESEWPAEHRFPDVGVLTSRPNPTAAAGAVATAPLILPANLPEPIPHVSIEIRDVAERRLVTCIEVLSPTNKRGPGVEEYAAKRFQILSGPSHLLEIDLLRMGSRFPTTLPLPAVPYHYSAYLDDTSMPPSFVGTCGLFVAALVIADHRADMKGFRCSSAATQQDRTPPV